VSWPKGSRRPPEDRLALPPPTHDCQLGPTYSSSATRASEVQWSTGNNAVLAQDAVGGGVTVGDGALLVKSCNVSYEDLRAGAIAAQLSEELRQL
jgi:hypothetical protein